MSLYKSDYVCVKAWASAEGCIREKGKTSMVSTLVVSSKGVFTSVNVIYECVYMHML